MLRSFTPPDLEDYLEMSGNFYASDATDHPVPPDHFRRTFNELMRGSASARGWIILDDRERVVGYLLASLVWSNEYGGWLAWLEELYLKPESRRCGLGRQAMESAMEELRNQGQAKGFRLEMTRANEPLVHLYRKLGFGEIPYSQMGRSV